jgi:hypothetical protein
LTPEIPRPDDFAAPPTAADHARWVEADRAARPARRARLRTRFDAAGIDAYFGARREHMRYLTGLTLQAGEENVAGTSGQFLISRDDVVVLADSRYTIQAERDVTDGRVVGGPRDLAQGWAELVASVGARRVGIEAAVVSHAVWRRLEVAAPDVELIPVEGWVEADRAIKEPAELERVAAACAVADRALAALLPKIRPGAISTRLPDESSKPTAAGQPTATGLATGSGSRRTSCRCSVRPPSTRRSYRPPFSRSSQASISKGRPAFGSRISSSWMPERADSSA